MIEQDLQIRVADALSALGIARDSIRGNFIPTPAGDVMGEERPGSEILADIVTGVRAADDYGWLCPVAVQFSIHLRFRADAYPDSGRVIDVLGPILDMVTAWARETNGTPGSETGSLETDGFMPGGVRLDGGTSPYFDDAISAWSATINFTIRGRIKN